MPIDPGPSMPPVTFSWRRRFVCFARTRCCKSQVATGVKIPGSVANPSQSVGLRSGVHQKKIVIWVFPSSLVVSLCEIPTTESPIPVACRRTRPTTHFASPQPAPAPTATANCTAPFCWLHKHKHFAAITLGLIRSFSCCNLTSASRRKSRPLFCLSVGIIIIHRHLQLPFPFSIVAFLWFRDIHHN